MDTSKHYIKMCSKAKEVQKLWKPTINDYCIWGGNPSVIDAKSLSCYFNGDVRSRNYWEEYAKEKGYTCYPIDNIFCMFSVEKNKENEAKEVLEQRRGCYTDYEFCFWLPRQDQLQEMIKTNNIVNLCHSFYSQMLLYNNCGDYIYPDLDEFTSMEQLWLAFVMKEKWNKQWLNGEWECIK